MKREERLNLLYSEFDKFAKEFSDTTNGNFFNIYSDAENSLLNVFLLLLTFLLSSSFST